MSFSKPFHYLVSVVTTCNINKYKTIMLTDASKQCYGTGWLSNKANVIKGIVMVESKPQKNTRGNPRYRYHWGYRKNDTCYRILSLGIFFFVIKQRCKYLLKCSGLFSITPTPYLVICIKCVYTVCNVQQIVILFMIIGHLMFILFVIYDCDKF